jgi:hypothetical protein
MIIGCQLFLLRNKYSLTAFCYNVNCPVPILLSLHRGRFTGEKRTAVRLLFIHQITDVPAPAMSCW